MIDFVLKFLATSTIFIVLYFVLLQYVKSFKINRWYLLSSLILALMIPFFVFEVEEPAMGIPLIEEMPAVQYEAPIESQEDFVESVQYVNAEAVPPPVDNSRPLIYDVIIGVMALYFIGAVVMAIRFNRNLRRLYRKIVNAEQIREDEVTIVLLDEPISPFSFFRFLFVNRDEYRSGLEKDILRHEMAHIRQNHTWDVIFIETLLVFFWFNPALYFYRKAIQTNHEFLADEAVVSTGNHFNYLSLLINTVSQKHITTLVSPFNHSLIKKRLLMITRKPSQLRSHAFQLFSVLILLATIAIFSECTYAKAENSSIADNTFSDTNPIPGVSHEICTDTIIQNALQGDTIVDSLHALDPLAIKPAAPLNVQTPVNLNLNFDSLGLSKDLAFLSSPEFINGIVDVEGLSKIISETVGSKEFTANLQKLTDKAIKDSDYYDSPEFKAHIKKIEKDAAKIEAYYNSRKFKSNIKKIEKDAAKMEAKYNSPEFKAHIKKIEDDAAKIEAYYNSPEFKAKIAKIEREAEESARKAEDARINSPEFKAKIAKIEREAEERARKAEEARINSPEFKAKMEKIERNAEEQGRKEAEKARKAAEARALKTN
ncbi:M56 family metallopeptidase [Sphingobacterium spiritivorum]|uniref:M56 family metallopeptidase n=1 Tax=Sphingobacterium spiritivorum TaxID=258 RepID=UPI0019198751|nr:M56 family metallopeptidase [Sphingobacterium spiritivorum]QQT26889.1 transcriptional regulator [Sphingobacterium spiritivorum]